MKRELLSAEDIQKIVQDQVNNIREVREDKAEIRVPLPQRCIADGSGCNWGMSVFGNGVGYVGSINKVVDWARSQFNLKAE